MKTSLNIENALFRAAQREAQRQGKTLSDTITFWARVGYDFLKKGKHARRKQVKTLDLGGPSRLDLSSRKHWMDLLS